MSPFMPDEYAVKATTFYQRGRCKHPYHPSAPLPPLRGSSRRGRKSVSDSRHASIGGPGRAGHIRGLVRGKEKLTPANFSRPPGAPRGKGRSKRSNSPAVSNKDFHNG